jgi:TIR domain
VTTPEVSRGGEAPDAAEPGRYDAFLSYAREDSEFVVEYLRTKLQARGLQVWVDVEDILGGAKWHDRVKRGIEACKAFVFVISPDSLASDHCREELEDAIALNKLIIPIMYRDVGEGVTLPPSVADAEWVFLREENDPTTGLERLIDALQTDLAWRDQHTRLAGRTREWLDADGTAATCCVGPTSARPRRGCPGRRDIAWRRPPSRPITSPEADRPRAGASALWSGAGKKVPTLQVVHAASFGGFGTEPEDAAFSPDGTLVAIGYSDGTAGVFDGRTGRIENIINTSRAPVLGVQFSAIGNMLITRQADGNVRVWDPLSGQQLALLTLQTNLFNAGALSPDGSRYAGGEIKGAFKPSAGTGRWSQSELRPRRSSTCAARAR